MTATTILLVALTAVSAGPEKRYPFTRGSDLSPGLLRNWTLGKRPFDPPDPSRPTIVFAQGFNPFPHSIRSVAAEHMAELIARRGGGVNVMGWEWNGATWAGLRPDTNQKNAVDHGRRLAHALRAAGLTPWKVHLVGHSTGAMIAASAARTLKDETGVPAGQVTLLDPAGLYHDVVFQELSVGTSAYRVENYWTKGISGFGHAVNLPGVIDYEIHSPPTIIGLVILPRSAHWFVAMWYFETIADPRRPAGYNWSLPCVAWFNAP